MKQNNFYAKPSLILPAARQLDALLIFSASTDLITTRF